MTLRPENASQQQDGNDQARQVGRGNASRTRGAGTRAGQEEADQDAVREAAAAATAVAAPETGLSPVGATRLAALAAFLAASARLGGGVRGSAHGATVTVAYARTDIPDDLNAFATQRDNVYYWADDTPVARTGWVSRQEMSLEKVPEHVRGAVLAAENHGFYSDPGVSLQGVTRAFWQTVSGGDTQGGSTITQQYVKNVYLSQDRSLSRKFTEILMAVELDRQRSEDQILEDYLNTSWFGRGSYGLQRAAQAYYGKEVFNSTPARARSWPPCSRVRRSTNPPSAPPTASARSSDGSGRWTAWWTSAGWAGPSGRRSATGPVEGGAAQAGAETTPVRGVLLGRRAGERRPAVLPLPAGGEGEQRT